MILSIVLKVEEVADSYVRYVEQTADRPPIVGTLDIERWALPETVPSQMRLTLEFRRDRRDSSEEMSELTLEKEEPGKGLSVGVKVTIVKNTMTGTKYPPEWLAQYLGRTGVVLWRTREGAMVRLAEGATWFPYAELSAVD